MDAVLLFKSVILGLVEGVTEFIPVSSTGHLILAGDLLGLSDEKAKVFEVFIQLGAILSVVWLYREKISSVIRGFPKREEARSLAMNIIVAFLPAAFVGLLLHKAIKALSLQSGHGCRRPYRRRNSDPCDRKDAPPGGREER